MATLTAHAEDAQDIAAALLKFESYLPVELAGEVAALATELFGIKTAILDLHAQCRDPRNARRMDGYYDEKDVVISSISYTFKDIHRRLGGLARPGYRSRREAYQTVWRELDDFFFDESSNQLADRLHHYKNFIQELTEVIIGHHEHPDFEDLYDSINHLLEIQEESRVIDDLDRLALGTPRPARSWERRRPYGLDNRGQPNARGAPRPLFRRPPSPNPFDQSLPLSPGASHSSPPSTITSSSAADSASGGSDMPRHWLTDVWAQYHSNTQFATTGTESACFGDHTRGASKKLREEYDKMVTLPFEQTSRLELRIYLRPHDRRARIWCRMERRNGHIEAVEPVAKLKILRKDSCLQLCKTDSQRRLRLWANLRFITYERLVLFHCTFLALKAQEDSRHPTRLDDHVLHGEIEVFSAKIQDGSFVHALQIFKDDDSKGVRLQASVLRGEMQRAPVWTAFIKYNMMARDWIKRRESRKVLIADLSRYLFSRSYIPQMAPSGDHELHFLRSTDATEFMEAIEDLAERRI